MESCALGLCSSLESRFSAVWTFREVLLIQQMKMNPAWGVSRPDVTWQVWFMHILKNYGLKKLSLIVKSCYCMLFTCFTTTQPVCYSSGANNAPWISNKGAGKPLWKVWFLKRAGGWMCQADLPLSGVKAVGCAAHSCLPLHSHSVVTWDTSPRLRWGCCPKPPKTTHVIMLMSSIYVFLAVGTFFFSKSL